MSAGYSKASPGARSVAAANDHKQHEGRCSADTGATAVDGAATNGGMQGTTQRRPETTGLMPVLPEALGTHIRFESSSSAEEEEPQPMLEDSSVISQLQCGTDDAGRPVFLISEEARKAAFPEDSIPEPAAASRQREKQHASHHSTFEEPVKPEKRWYALLS